MRQVLLFPWSVSHIFVPHYVFLSGYINGGEEFTTVIMPLIYRHVHQLFTVEGD